MVLMTLSVVVSITDTLSDDWLATYRRFPSRDTTQPKGSLPTLIDLTTARVTVLITDTLALAILATYSFLLSGVRASRRGSFPTGISCSFKLASPWTLKT